MEGKEQKKHQQTGNYTSRIRGEAPEVNKVIAAVKRKVFWTTV